MNRQNLLVILVVAVLTVCLWALLNRPHQEPAWPNTIMGFAFSPMHAEHDPVAGRLPDRESIDADLALLAGTVHALRTYTVQGTMAEVPALARKYGINVALGAWVGGDRLRDEAEIDRLIAVVRGSYRNVVRIMVGNEAIHRGDVPVEQLARHLDRVRGDTRYAGEHC